MSWLTWWALYLVLGLIIGINIHIQQYLGNRGLPKDVDPNTPFYRVWSTLVFMFIWPLIIIGEIGYWFSKE